MLPTFVEAQRAFLCKGQSVLTNGIPHIFLGSGSSHSGIPLHSWQSSSSPLAGGQPRVTGVKEPPQAAHASKVDNRSPHRSASCFSSSGSCAQLSRERGLPACRGRDSLRLHCIWQERSRQGKYQFDFMFLRMSSCGKGLGGLHLQAIRAVGNAPKEHYWAQSQLDLLVSV